MTHLGSILKDGKVFAATMVLNEITEIKKAREALEDSERQKNAILDASAARIRLADTDMRIIWANHAHERDLNIRPEDIIGKHCYTVFVQRNTPCPECPSKKALSSGKIEHAVLTRPSQNSEKEIYLDSYAVPLKDKAGKILSCVHITHDITKRVSAEKALQAREKELRRKAINLKITNIALQVLLKQREDDKRELEENMLSNTEQLILPYIEKLRNTGLSDLQKTYLRDLEKRLKDITSPFLRTLSSTCLNISPSEMHVATDIKEGKTTKEIAESMNLSIRAIEFHRNNLRDKLGLKHKKVNLRSYLLSLP
jgi:PAS domain S-box-containing protein